MKIKKLCHPIRYFIAWLQQHKYLDGLSDKSYCALVMFSRTGRLPNYKHPKGFNEKMQWLKLNNRCPELTTLVDKIEAKKIVTTIIGDEYIIPTLKKWNCVEDIVWEDLPNKFVLKCNHDGGVIICRDKSTFDFERAKEELEKRLMTNYFDHAREWPYKNILPCIFAEPFVQDGKNENLPVYKFMCFSGEPRIIQTIQNDKTPRETIDYFDLEWNLLDLKQNYENSPVLLKKPDLLGEMIDIAKKLCVGHPFIRIDLYQVNGTIKFSEFTLFSDAGFEPFRPVKWDKTLGNWVKLPEIIANNQKEYT